MHSPPCIPDLEHATFILPLSPPVLSARMLVYGKASPVPVTSRKFLPGTCGSNSPGLSARMLLPGRRLHLPSLGSEVYAGMLSPLSAYAMPGTDLANAIVCYPPTPRPVLTYRMPLLLSVYSKQFAESLKPLPEHPQIVSYFAAGFPDCETDQAPQRTSKARRFAPLWA
eukprot:2507672-Rhodomonas_salina.2